MLGSSGGVIFYEKTRLTIRPCEYKGGKGWLLHSMSTPPENRRKGHSKKLLRICKKFANRTNTPLTFFAGAFWDKPVSTENLVVYYLRMGFTLERFNGDEPWFVYNPKKRKRNRTG